MFQTYSHVARPVDHRCRWWQRFYTSAQVLGINPEYVEGAETLPGRTERKGADIELDVWDVVMDAEANHHVKQRGWRHMIGIVAPKWDGVPMMVWITPDAEVKQEIKSSGATHLLKGSGPNAAMVRTARYVLEGASDSERLLRLLAVCRAAGKDVSRLVAPEAQEQEGVPTQEDEDSISAVAGA